MKLFKSTGRRHQSNKLRRRLGLETLQSRELFYAPPFTPVGPPTPPAEEAPPAENSQSPGESNSTTPAIEPTGTDVGWFPQGDSFHGTRFVPTPLGLFPDGSVQSVTPEISPRVVELLDASNRGPIRSTLHRPRVAFGAPTGTLAGRNPRLIELTTMQENWAHAYGNVVHSHQRIENAPENLGPRVDIDLIYSWLENFLLFDAGNLATVQVYRPGPIEFPLPEGESYAIFTVNTLDHSGGEDRGWRLLNTLQLSVNDLHIPVRLHSRPDDHQLTAVTLGNHMLVGVRAWRIYESNIGWICIETESYEQRNGRINNRAAQIGGRIAMEEIWHRYLRNLGHAATGGTDRFSAPPSQWTVLPEGTPNPWRNPRTVPVPQVDPDPFSFPILKRANENSK